MIVNEHSLAALNIMINYLTQINEYITAYQNVICKFGGNLTHYCMKHTTEQSV